MKKLLSIVIILLTINTNSLAETNYNYKIMKHENYNQNKIEENISVVKEENLEKVLNKIYRNFSENYNVELFPEGLGFQITTESNGTVMGYATAGGIIYYGMENYKWEEKPLYFITMHEMGHLFQQRYLTKEDFQKYCELREMNIETYIKTSKKIKNENPQLTDFQISYLLSTQEMLAEDFRMIFSEEDFNTKNSQFLWGNLTEKQHKEIKDFFIEILKRERTEEIAMEILIKNTTTTYGMFGY